jgi:hypothetical protein
MPTSAVPPDALDLPAPPLSPSPSAPKTRRSPHAERPSAKQRTALALVTGPMGSLTNSYIALEPPMPESFATQEKPSGPNEEYREGPGSRVRLGWSISVELDAETRAVLRGVGRRSGVGPLYRASYGFVSA